MSTATTLDGTLRLPEAFTMIAGGVLYTVWNMETGTPPKS